ncbi:MAG: peptide-methionine (R)-S-oxide reductase MsrB [Bacilli bacterium]|nr:peptide-methionine (R)-S-oxide reductase MsrB [Bacilli bacterium]
MKKNIPELSPFQRKVIYENATEPPFDNEYWNNHQEGIYVDAVDGTPLFASYDKFDSGTGWPSFTRPINDGILKNVDDYSLPRYRVEVRTKGSDIHLGHVFEDGPIKEGGLRYCINSAALRFVPKEELEKEGLVDLWKKK